MSPYSVTNSQISTTTSTSAGTSGPMRLDDSSPPLANGGWRLAPVFDTEDLGAVDVYVRHGDVPMVAEQATELIYKARTIFYLAFSRFFV